MFIVIENRRPHMHGDRVMVHASMATAMDHVSHNLPDVKWTTYATGGVHATGMYHQYDGYEDRFITRTFAIYRI